MKYIGIGSYRIDNLIKSIVYRIETNFFKYRTTLTGICGEQILYPVHKIYILDGTLRLLELHLNTSCRFLHVHSEKLHSLVDSQCNIPQNKH